MQTDARVSLQESLDSLTNDESPPLNGLLRVDYIVLRRVNARKNHVHVEFVDGDVKDGNEWSEGPFPVYTTIERLFEMKDTMDRGARREVFGRRKLSDGEHTGPLIGKEGWYEELDESSDGDDMVAEHAVGSGRVDRNQPGEPGALKAQTTPSQPSDRAIPRASSISEKAERRWCRSPWPPRALGCFLSLPLKASGSRGRGLEIGDGR